MIDPRLINWKALPTAAQADRNIFICGIRVNSLKRCVPNSYEIAALEMQKRKNFLWLEVLNKYGS